MAPFAKTYGWNDEIGFVIAFVIGIAFGFFLEQGGFGNARKLAMQFYLRDLTVFKVMFTAICTAMIGLIFLQYFGVLNFDLIYLNPTYIYAAIVGGVIMGIGFVVGGYCPGTSLVGAATLKTDAFFFIGGFLLGVFIFGETFPLGETGVALADGEKSFIQDIYTGGHLGDRATLPEYFNTSAGIIAFIILVIALAGFVGAEWLEKRFGEKENS